MEKNINVKWNGCNWVGKGWCNFKRKAKSFITRGAFGNQEWSKSIPEGYNFTFTKKEKESGN